jgi:hypothetical protein
MTIRLSKSQRLRAELDQVRARYDSGAIPLSVYYTLRELEEEIAWREHRSANRQHSTSGAH